MPRALGHLDLYPRASVAAVVHPVVDQPRVPPYRGRSRAVASDASVPVTSSW